MKNLKITTTVAVTAALVLTSCIDDNYDLSDINTLSRIPVTDLVVPLNVEPIVLDDVLDIDDNENIETVTIDGKKVYALSRGGNVNSDRVAISPITVNAPSIAPAQLTLNGVPAFQNAPLKSRAKISYENLTMKYEIQENLTSDFSLHSGDIDHSLISLHSIETYDNIKVNVSLHIPSEIAHIVETVNFSGVQLQLPKGLAHSDGTPPCFDLGKGQKASYNPGTGLVTLNGNLPFDDNGNCSISLSVNKLDLQAANVGIEDHAFAYDGKIGVLKGGTINLTPNGNLELPTSLNFSANYSISNFKVRNFSGEVDYLINGVDINPIDLSNLPEFLSDPETQIYIGNPEILLGVTNTAAAYHVDLSGNISLKSIFEGNNVKSIESDNFEIGYDRGVARYNIVLTDRDKAPVAVEGFDNPEPRKFVFPGLSDVLAYSGKPLGLPKTIDVDLPGIHFKGDVVKFPVRMTATGKEGTLDPMVGEYRFFAPLSFGPESRIVYNKTENDFGSEDLEDLTITSLKLTAHATSQLPVDVTLRVYPLDKQGKELGTCVSPLSLAKGESRDVTFEISGTLGSPIKGLDGVRYIAVVENPDPDKSLSPDLTISLSDIKITVSGYYEKEF